MTVYCAEFPTFRGDRILLNFFCHSDEKPTLLISIMDADESLIPTAELTLPEAGRFRDLIRELCTEGDKPGVRE